MCHLFCAALWLAGVLGHSNPNVVISLVVYCEPTLFYHQLCAEKKPILECQLQLLTTISEQVTGVPLPYPRLYYQALQHTTITLNITPAPRATGEPHVLQVGLGD